MPIAGVLRRDYIALVGRACKILARKIKTGRLCPNKAAAVLLMPFQINNIERGFYFIPKLFIPGCKPAKKFRSNFSC